MTRIAAVILAGGRASRLGGINKALIEIGGRRLIDRALDAVCGCTPIVLSVAQPGFEIAGTIAVHDLPGAYGGPLAGIAAAVHRLLDESPDLLLSLAVDTPFFPADFAARAAPLLDGTAAVVAAYGGQDYPTNALWRFDALRTLPARVRSATAPHSLKHLAAELGAVPLDYAPLLPDDPFANVNTPQDMAILNARAAVRPMG